MVWESCLSVSVHSITFKAVGILTNGKWYKNNSLCKKMGDQYPRPPRFRYSCEIHRKNKERCRAREMNGRLNNHHHNRRRMHFFGGQFYTWSGFLDARAVFRILVERVDILIAINSYLHSNFTVQMAQLGDSCPCH